MTPLRSFLFAPGDSDRKMEKAGDSGADAVILDLEDSVAPSEKTIARQKVAELLGGAERRCQLWVRINPLESGLADQDLAAVLPGRPDGIMLPKAEGPQDVAALSARLDPSDPDRRIKILPVATETAAAPFHLGDYKNHDIPRLYGLTWGAEDLSTALGASTNRSADGDWAFTYKMVRSLTLMAARAAGVEPVETLYVDFRDTEGLKATSRAARAEGFSGRLAIHPAQVAGINESFMPSTEEIAQAKRVVAAFAASPGAGTVGIDGKMYDIPHLRQAERTLSLARAFAT